MPDFEFGGVSADFTNSLRDQLTRDRLVRVLGAANAPLTGGFDETVQSARMYGMIAAHSKRVTGLSDPDTGLSWSPPKLFEDPEAIQENADLFFRALPENSPELITAWVRAINRFVFGDTSIAAEELQGTGTDEDFLAKPGSASPSDSRTAPPSVGANRSRSQKKRTKRRKAR